MNSNNSIPLFIKLRGCINCDASKTHKKECGTDYGFDHELMVRCLLSGCFNYGVTLQRPFIDPAEVIRVVKEKYPERLDEAKNYVKNTITMFGSFFKALNINLEELLDESLNRCGVTEEDF